MSEVLQSPEASKTLESLDDIRKKIDSIDNSVHDLLMERASLVSSVAHAKRGSGMQIVQPAREARLMRRLLGRHQGPLPRKTIVRIWRELISSVSLLQTGLSVVVADEAEGYAQWDMAKNYFGSSVPMHAVKGLQNAISEIVENKASFAVLPWPELDGEAPWWSNLLNHQADEPLSIICALPYGKTERLKNSDVYDKALVVSKIAFMPSDLDSSFIGLEVDADVSRARIKDRAQALGLDVVNLYSASVAHNRSAKIHLMHVNGFVERGSEEVSDLAKSLASACHYCEAIGGYPVIPDSEDTPQ